MADPNDKVPGQASGRYYVDSQCIDCDLCRETAPANFIRNDEAGFSYVFKQPETPEEETLCKDALDNCPVEAIGKDGVAAPFVSILSGVAACSFGVIRRSTLDLRPPDSLVSEGRTSSVECRIAPKP